MFARVKSIFVFITRLWLGGIFLLFLAFVLGFLWFYHTLPQPMQRPFSARAQAIVVFTGSRARVPSALSLLRASHAPILLVSGVHRNTVSSDFMGREGSLFGKIVLGYTARNTFENAVETTLWVRSNSVSKIILVTSALHMRRSLLYVRHLSPQLEIVPFSVQYPSIYRWDALFKEYAKYILSLAHRFFATLPEEFPTPRSF